MSNNESDNDDTYKFSEEPISFELPQEFTSFNSNYEVSNNVSVSSSNQQYAKSSWVWKHFKQSKDRMYDVYKVKVMNLSDKEVECGHKFIHDGNTENMSSYLQTIEWLDATLPLSDNSDDRANSRKLKKLLLLPHKWDLLS
ncbi:12969_t:CDS:2 [Dentiscutata heterogama]|uniref:12969_t:CDS:1 n=1 Tax=Dentiscutata heterogama TaxID=1316150 RepID=A0ACA9KJI2_9GLOM|nr:12969_t:CDS:2 [Dentiscutata heterogama]